MAKELIIGGLIGLIALMVIWAVSLWDLSQSRKTSGRRNFYLVFFIPLIIVAILGAFIFHDLTITLLAYPWYIILGVFAVVILYFGFLAKSLYDAGGTEKLGWFTLLIILSPLWILYMATEYGR